jgi:serine/threonine protein phosphatase PrpC
MHQHHVRFESNAVYVTAASCTDTGRVRIQNEDALALCEPPDQERLARLGRLYLLADGAGGHAAGEVASRLAVETIASVYYQKATTDEETEDSVQECDSALKLQGLQDLALPRRRLIKAFDAAHRYIRHLGALQCDYTGMVTTCLAVVVKGAHVLIAHVGDSRAYLLRASPGSQPTLTSLTTDHSMANALARAGVMTAEQARNSPFRHILVRALGENKANAQEPDITTCVVQAGDVMILCCDGLWSLLSEEQIALVVRANTPQVACHELVRLANEAGGNDNISVVLLSFTSSIGREG